MARPKKSLKVKEPIRIRERKLADGNDRGIKQWDKIKRSNMSLVVQT